MPYMVDGNHTHVGNFKCSQKHGPLSAGKKGWSCPLLLFMSLFYDVGLTGKNTARLNLCPFKNESCFKLKVVIFQIKS